MKHFFATLLAVAALSPAAMAIEIPTVAPVKVDFNEWDAESFANSFTFEYVDGYGAEFSFGNKYGGMSTNKFTNLVSIKNWPVNKDADNWVISKTPVMLTAGATYTITCTVSTGQSGADNNETFEFKAGSQATASAMTAQLIKSTTFNCDGISVGDTKTYDTTFTPTTSGAYYFGLHNTTKADDGLRFGYHGFTVTYTGGEPEDPSLSGIEDIYVDDNQAVELYDLNGRRVNDATVPGVYIVRRADGSTSKLVIR